MQLANPRGLAWDSFGNSLAIADSNNNRIRLVGAGGAMNSVTAGAATYTAAFSAAGDLYYSVAYAVRRRTAAGAISLFAGGNGLGDLGDGGLAHGGPAGADRGPGLRADGTVYIGDLSNHRIRAVSPGGTIRAHAATGTPGPGGDGGAALAAQLNQPYGWPWIPITTSLWPISRISG